MEALPPDVLAGLLRRAIEDIVDVDLIDESRHAGDRERAQLVKTIGLINNEEMR